MLLGGVGGESGELVQTLQASADPITLHTDLYAALLCYIQLQGGLGPLRGLNGGSHDIVIPLLLLLKYMHAHMHTCTPRLQSTRIVKMTIILGDR